MLPRFRWAAAVLLLLGLAGCRSEPSAQARATPLPRPDLCRTLDRALIGAAMLGSVTGCSLGGSEQEGYGAEFTGTAVPARGKKAQALLAVAYGRRYDPKTGIDHWAGVGVEKGSRVALIGVGDQAVFDPRHAPQLAFVRGPLYLTVSLNITGAPVPPQRLDDHLLAVGNDLLSALS